MPQLQCQSCGAAMTLAEPIPRDAECESCKRDLRSCRNCRHYDPAYNNACTETMADPVEDKLRRNFCEFFYFNRAAFTAGAGAQPNRADDARKKLDALFGGAPAQKDRASDARKKLDDLFKKPGADDDDEP